MNFLPPLAPAQAGLQYFTETGLDARVRGHEGGRRVLTASVRVSR